MLRGFIELNQYKKDACLCLAISKIMGVYVLLLSLNSGIEVSKNRILQLEETDLPYQRPNHSANDWFALRGEGRRSLTPTLRAAAKHINSKSATQRI
jgi:hypothetical protein